MTKFFLKLSGIAFVFALLIATGCNEDDPIINTLGPEIQLLSGTGLVTTDVELFENEAFKVQVSADKGDNTLKTLSFTVDGVEPKGTDLAGYITKITSGGADVTPQNPLLILGAAKDGATWEFDLVPFGQLVDETATYSFTVEDDAGKKASVSFDVTIVAPAGTPIERTLTGVLFNQAGPSGYGALDLDEGYRTGVTTAGPNAGPADAEIRDLGLDCTVPAPGLNWRRQIGTMNGADLRQVDLTMVENFNFDNVTKVEEVIGAYDTGKTFADDVSRNCGTGATANVTDVTAELQAGDMFVVLRNSKYYLIRVDAVMETNADNDDKYELSIKY